MTRDIDASNPPLWESTRIGATSSPALWPRPAAPVRSPSPNRSPVTRLHLPRTQTAGGIGIRRRQGGQAGGEGYAVARGAVCGDGAAVGRDELGDDGQSDARAAGARSAAAIVALEDVGQVVGGDAGSGVGDGEVGPPLGLVQGDGDRAAGGD